MGSIAICSVYSRSKRAPTAWNVPAQVSAPTMMAAFGPRTLRTDTLDASAHLGGRPPGEGHQENPSRIDAVDDQMGDPVRQGIGLAGSRPGYDQERSRRRPRVFSDTVFGGPPLIVVELFQINSGHCRGSVRARRERRLSTIPVLFATPQLRLGLARPGARGCRWSSPKQWPVILPAALSGHRFAPGAWRPTNLKHLHNAPPPGALAGREMLLLLQRF